MPRKYAGCDDSRFSNTRSDSCEGVYAFTNRFGLPLGSHGASDNAARNNVPVAKVHEDPNVVAAANEADPADVRVAQEVWSAGKVVLREQLFQSRGHFLFATSGSRVGEHIGVVPFAPVDGAVGMTPW